MQWARSFGPDQYFNYLDGGVASDGGAWIATESHSHPGSNPSHWFYLLKTDGFGRTRGCCDQEDVPLVETTVAVSAVLQNVTRATVAGPLASASLDSADQTCNPLTLCESSAEYLCNGVLTGECLCGSNADAVPFLLDAGEAGIQEAATCAPGNGPGGR